MGEFCQIHKDVLALGTCWYCQRFLCSQCLQRQGDYYFCVDGVACVDYQQQINNTSGKIE